jgi:hypothetical protein
LASSATTSNPQSWNRYAYVLNNPLVFVDPTGMRGGRFGEIEVYEGSMSSNMMGDNEADLPSWNMASGGDRPYWEYEQSVQEDSGETEKDNIPKVLKVTIKAIDVAKDPNGKPYEGGFDYGGQEIAGEVAECGMFELTVKYVSNVGPDFPNSSQTIELKGRIENEATLFKGPEIKLLKSESDTEKFTYEAKFIYREKNVLGGSQIGTSGTTSFIARMTERERLGTKTTDSKLYYIPVRNTMPGTRQPCQTRPRIVNLIQTRPRVVKM